jgi:AraC-like DNA-binding protein
LDIDKIREFRPFEAEFRSKRIGDVCMTYSRVWNATGSIRWIRGRERIVKDLDQCMVLMIVREGEVSHTQYGTTERLSRGGMILIDSREAYRVERFGSAASFNVRLPLDLLKAALPAPERFCGTALDARSGMNAIMGDLLMATWRHAEDTSSHETALMLDRILDAISTIFRSVKTRSNSVRPPATLHYDRAIRFIESHLSDVQLRPSRIASSLKISTGHLHAVMRSHGTSIGRLVMERRLDNSRRDLLHPELRSHTIAQIAMDWGFSDYAQFSKAFKRRFGVTPRAMRGAPGHLVSPGCS